MDIVDIKDIKVEVQIPYKDIDIKHDIHDIHDIHKEIIHHKCFYCGLSESIAFDDKGKPVCELCYVPEEELK